ncbi:MAG: SCO family protein [Haloferacaceae archaeon]
MRRRDYLRAVGATAAVAGGTAGCLGGGNPNTTLPEPERQFDSEDVPYPAWGQQIPDVTLPEPLAGGEIAVRDVETPSLLTFFYSHCNTVCPVLISTMREVQTHALNSGYGDEVAFLPVSFDPERDDADRLREYGDEMHVNLDAGDWHFLRPASKDRAKEVVADEFGVYFERTHPGDMNMYMFTHTALTLLVNADGYVERAYRTKSPDEQTIIADLKTVR